MSPHGSRADESLDSADDDYEDEEEEEEEEPDDEGAPAGRSTKYMEPCLRDACSISPFRRRYSSMSAADGGGGGGGVGSGLSIALACGGGRRMGTAAAVPSRSFLAAATPSPRVGDAAPSFRSTELELMVVRKQFKINSNKLIIFN